MSVNKVFLRGYVGQDPKAFGQPGHQVTKLSLAVSTKWRDANGEKKEKTDWFNCVAFGKTGEYIMNRVRKGDMLAIDEGKLQTSTWENKNGQKVTETSVVIGSWEVWQSNKRVRDTSQSEPKTAEQSDFGDMPQFDPDEEIPF